MSNSETLRNVIRVVDASEMPELRVGVDSEGIASIFDERLSETWHIQASWAHSGQTTVNLANRTKGMAKVAFTRLSFQDAVEECLARILVRRIRAKVGRA